MKSRKKVVVVGGGFAGLACARGLRRTDVDVVLLDRRNFHLFQPLLYQVATGGLSPANIAAPLRSIFRRQSNVSTLVGEVAGFDLRRRQVLLRDGVAIDYDYLVIATGATHHYFGNEARWEAKAPGLKTVEDATRIRRNILAAFEEAERSDDASLRAALLTFVIVGGGPTGLEMAGAICELSRQTMAREFRRIDPAKARVILLEYSPDILNNFSPKLRASAKKQLMDLGAEVWNHTRLMDIQTDHVIVEREGSSERVDARTVIWAAGVQASPLGAELARSFETPPALDPAGRIAVNRHCSFEEHPNVFVVGDLAHFLPESGKPLPGLAPVAMQQGKYVGRCIAADLVGKPVSKPFRYVDKGIMATIGRSKAVAETKHIRMSGKLAWIGWLLIHIMYLVRFENRALVLFQWFWNYITRNRSARLITHGDSRKEPASEKGAGDK